MTKRQHSQVKTNAAALLLALGSVVAAPAARAADPAPANGSTQAENPCGPRKRAANPCGPSNPCGPKRRRQQAD